MIEDTAARLRAHVEFLCSRACAGREPGSREGLAARNYIVDQLTAADWRPVIQPVRGCHGANVIAHRAGSGQTILIGAHYDHLGRAMGDEAYWGADDNAAAVAVVLELARRLRDTPRDRDVMLVAFDGEEPPHFLTDEMGSMQFVDDPPLPLDDIAVAIILDLVGHPIGPHNAPRRVRNALFVLGGEKASGLGGVVNTAAAGVDNLRVVQLDLDIVPPLSDYEPFRRRRVPVLFLTGGRWRHYHELTDTPDKLDYEKLAATADFLDRFIVECSGPLGRYEPTAGAFRTTALDLRALAEDLAPVLPQAQGIVGDLDGLLPRLKDGGSIAPDDHSALLFALARLEQLIA